MAGRSFVALAAIAVGLSLMPAAATAQGGSRQAYKQFFSSPEPGASAGITSQILYRHPDDPDRKPIAVRREVFTFPAGTGFDPAVVPYCTASDDEVEEKGEAACPSGSRVLAGDGTVMSGFPLAGETPTEVDGYENGTGLTLLATVPMFGLRVVTRGVRVGRTITVDIPRSPIGGPPDGESPLRHVDNVGIPRALGGRAYVRTPEVCPAEGHWTFQGQFTYADGVTQRATHLMRCNRDALGPRIRVRGVPRRRCARRAFRVRVAIADKSRLRRVHVRVNGRLIRATVRTRFSARVATSRLRAGRHRLSVIARDVSGNRTRRTTRFRRCAR